MVALATTPLDEERQMQATMSQAQGLPAGPQPGPVQPALSGAMAAEGPVQAASGPETAGPTNIDPEIGRTVAQQSAEAVKTADAAEKNRINEELEGTFGKGAVEQAYQDALKRLGGEKKFDPKLDKSDWGLFLMDFGMRMMSESGKWDAQLGGAIGTAGSQAMGGLQARQMAEQQGVVDYNKQARAEARGLADAEMAREKDIRGQDVIWTREGGMRATGPGGALEPVIVDGKAIQPGLTPGQGARGFASDRSRSALEMAGYSPEEAAEIEAGGLTNSEIRAAARKAWEMALERDNQIPSPIDGKPKYAGDFNKEEREAWRLQYFNELRGSAGPGTRQPEEPALSPNPGRATNTGGGLPPPPWER